MSLTLRRTKGSQLTWDEVDANWTAGRTFDGTVLLGGEATAFDDLVMPLITGKQGVFDKPMWDGTNAGFIYTPNAADEVMYLNIQLPHRWKEGSDVYPHVHWHQAAAIVPTWTATYRWTNIGAAVSGTWSTYVMNQHVNTYVSGTIHQISKGAAPLAGTGKTISSMLQVQLTRDDVNVGNVLATSFDVHIEVDSFGSDAEYSK